VWASVTPDVVVHLLGLQTDVVLHAHLETAVDASRQLAVTTLSNARALVAGYMLLGQVVRFFLVTSRAATEFERRVELGEEPPLEGVRGRVIRLCGRSSDVTSLSLHLHGDHILPVYEDAAAAAPLVRSCHEAWGGVPVPV